MGNWGIGHGGVGATLRKGGGGSITVAVSSDARMEIRHSPDDVCKRDEVTRLVARAVGNR